MNKTTILAISSVFVASILAITAFEAEAKPPSETSTDTIPKEIQLVPMAGKKMVFMDSQGSSFLFYGDTLCGINLGVVTASSPRTLYIEFATTTTVEHLQLQANCDGITNNDQIKLVGAIDAVFQPNDFLIVHESAGWNEVYRQQTP